MIFTGGEERWVLKPIAEYASLKILCGLKRDKIEKRLSLFAIVK